MPDPRRNPWLDLTEHQIGEMIAPVVPAGALRTAAPVEGGLVRTIYRISTGSPTHEFALRVYPGEPGACAGEVQILRALDGRLPVPRVLFADPAGERCGLPYLVYPWFHGTTLNAARKQGVPESLVGQAGALGRVAARLAACAGDPTLGSLPTTTVADRLRRALDELANGRARERLGPALADGLAELITRQRAALDALDERPALVHGDFGGRNILVRAEWDGHWTLSIIDWESARLGSPWWDVGSLFRYPTRYRPEFVARFAEGYASVAGKLPRDWYRLARLLDSVRQVSTLSATQELPEVFGECRDLIASIVQHHGDPIVAL